MKRFFRFLSLVGPLVSVLISTPSAAMEPDKALDIPRPPASLQLMSIQDLVEFIPNSDLRPIEMLFSQGHAFVSEIIIEKGGMSISTCPDMCESLLCQDATGLNNLRNTPYAFLINQAKVVQTWGPSRGLVINFDDPVIQFALIVYDMDTTNTLFLGASKQAKAFDNQLFVPEIQACLQELIYEKDSHSAVLLMTFAQPVRTINLYARRGQDVTERPLKIGGVLFKN